ncbi:MAG: ABC transporter permease subunit [Clostridiales bacterium]|nr:ABC transporter permease subunit [Clostridiales bacterium]
MKSLNKYLNLILPVVSILSIIAVWTVAARTINNDIIMPTVSQTLLEIKELFVNPRLSGEFWLSFLGTLWRSFVSFVISFVLGFSLGVLSAKIRLVKSCVSPIVSIVRALPTIAVVLVLTLWTNSFIAPVVVTMLVVFPTIFTQIESSFISLDRTVSEAARVDGADERGVFFLVELPQVLPAVFSSIGGGLSLNFKLMVAAEVIAQTANSIGYMLNTAKVYFEMPKMIAIVCIAVLFGLIIEFVFNKLADKSKCE